MSGSTTVIADRVYAFLLHRADRETAQDVLQEVFVVAFRRSEVVPDEPIGWLLGVARKLLANHHRGDRRHGVLIDRIADESTRITAPDADESDLRRAFVETLNRLPQPDREVLTLSGWYGLTPAEAAEALDCTPNAYTVRLHRARRRLAESLESAGLDSGTPAARLAEALRG